jgi:hypothetical protein
MGYPSNSEESTFPIVKEDIEEVKRAIREISDSMTRVAAERDLIKETKKRLKEKFGLKPKLLTRLAKTVFNDDFDVTEMEHDEFVEAYNKVK